MDKDKLKNIIIKASQLEKGKEIALAKEFIDIDSKIDSIEKGVKEINVSVDKKLSDISEELKKKLEEELNYEIDPEEIRGEKGERGEQGEKGDKGEQGVAGKDGKDGLDGIDGKDGLDGQNGLNGVDGSPDTPTQIKDKLETLKKDKRLDASAIKGLSKLHDETLNRAIGILDQRTQFLINKIPTGSSSPAGNDTEVQFNDEGAFAGNSGLKYNKTGRILKVDKGLIIGESNFGLTPPTSGILMNGVIHSGVWVNTIQSNAPYRFFDTTTDMISPVLHISNDYGQQYGADLRLYNFASAEYMITDGNLGALEFSANKELVTTLKEEVVGAKITSDSENDWTYGPGDAQYRANLKFYTSNAGTLTERGRFHGTGDFEVLGTGKVISPTILSPIIIGGTSTTQGLTLQTTSGVGATGADMHFLVGSNGATEAMTILNSGNVGIGQTSPNAKLHIVSANGRATNFTSTLTDLSGVIIGGLNTTNVNPPGASTANYYANYNQLIADGTLSNSNSAIGVYSKVIHQTTGTLGIVNSGLFEVLNTSSGTITTAVGVRIGTPSNSGTLTNTTGLYISSQTAGTQSNTPYGIYQAGTSDINYFAGNVGIGDTSPSVRLEVGVVADGSVLTLNGGASGVNLLTLNRNSGGVVQSYGLALSSGKLVFQDVTNTQFIFYSTYANFGGLGNLPTLNIGPYEPNNTSVGATGLLKSRGAGTTGTNTAGGNLFIASGVGRGDGTQSQIHFYTPNKVGSGTSEQTYGTAKMVILGDGSVGIGVTSPTGVLHLKAGTATASTAPLKFTSGTVNTTAEAGTMEYNNTFHLTNSDTTRRHIVTAPNTTKVTASAPYTNDGYIVVNIGGTDFKLMTTA